MKIVATAEAALLLEAEGGRIYVRTDRSRCCSGPMTYLLTSTDPVEGHQFELVGGEGFECWFDPGNLTPPDEIHLDVKGWRKKRVEAYWNGCAFAI